MNKKLNTNEKLNNFIAACKEKNALNPPARQAADRQTV